MMSPPGQSGWEGTCPASVIPPFGTGCHCTRGNAIPVRPIQSENRWLLLGVRWGDLLFADTPSVCTVLSASIQSDVCSFHYFQNGQTPEDHGWQEELLWESCCKWIFLSVLYWNALFYHFRSFLFLAPSARFSVHQYCESVCVCTLGTIPYHGTAVGNMITDNRIHYVNLCDWISLTNRRRSDGTDLWKRSGSGSSVYPLSMWLHEIWCPRSVE